jgi:hypothetical protein
LVDVHHHVWAPAFLKAPREGLMAMGFSMNDLTAIESRNAQRLLGRA